MHEVYSKDVHRLPVNVLSPQLLNHWNKKQILHVNISYHERYIAEMYCNFKIRVFNSTSSHRESSTVHLKLVRLFSTLLLSYCPVQYLRCEIRANVNRKGSIVVLGSVSEPPATHRLFNLFFFTFLSSSHHENSWNWIFLQAWTLRDDSWCWIKHLLWMMIIMR